MENAVVLSIWMYIKCRKITDDDRFIKHQQYIENIVHEILIYPLLITTTIGFTNDQMYKVGEFATDPLFWAQFIMLIVDLIDLIWTQV